MKHLALTFVFVVLTAAAAHAQTPLPRLQVVGNHLETREGDYITLKGVSLCSLEWHKPLEQIEQVSTGPDKWNANVLRLPVQVQEWKRVGPINYIKNYLDPAVKACRRNNVYCIIDWHEIGPWNDAENVRDLKDFWKRVAPRYATDPNILYEIYNEPDEPKEKSRENWLAWRAAAQPWVDQVRRDAPHTVLLVGSPHWAQMPDFAVADPFRGKNLAYVVHVYPNYKPSDWDALFGRASETLPIFMTEWGWSDQEKVRGQVIHGTQKDFGEPLKAYLEARPQISWTAWSYDPLCGPAMLGDDKDMAAFVKDWLAESGE